MEWTVVTVLIALFGFGVAVIRPVVSLTQSITKLTVVVESLQKEMSSLDTHNSESHRRLWEKNGEQDEKLEAHDRRIGKLESRQ